MLQEQVRMQVRKRCLRMVQSLTYFFVAHMYIYTYVLMGIYIYTHQYIYKYILLYIYYFLFFVFVVFYYRRNNKQYKYPGISHCQLSARTPESPVSLPTEKVACTWHVGCFLYVFISFLMICVCFLIYVYICAYIYIYV